MRKFKSRKKSSNKLLFILFICLSLLVIFKSNKVLLNSESLLDYLIEDNLNIKDKKINDIEFIMKYIFNLDYKEVEVKPVIIEKEVVEEQLPIVYIYNTHQSEEYKRSFLDSYNIPTTVLIASKILKENLESEGITTIVENNDLVQIRNNMELKYGKSYEVSRSALESAYKSNSSLKYFIDIHRDAGTHEKTTLISNNISYAKLLFVVGLDNPSYENNLKIVETLSNDLNNTLSGISRGIVKKSGLKVNGVYNQDFSENVMLIEVGGENNTIEEVNNTLNILASVLVKYIKGNNYGI